MLLSKGEEEKRKRTREIITNSETITNPIGAERSSRASSFFSGGILFLRMELLPGLGVEGGQCVFTKCYGEIEGKTKKANEKERNLSRTGAKGK